MYATLCQVLGGFHPSPTEIRHQHWANLTNYVDIRTALTPWCQCWFKSFPESVALQPRGENHSGSHDSPIWYLSNYHTRYDWPTVTNRDIQDGVSLLIILREMHIYFGNKCIAGRYCDYHSGALPACHAAVCHTIETRLKVGQYKISSTGGRPSNELPQFDYMAAYRDSRPDNDRRATCYIVFMTQTKMDMYSYATPRSPFTNRDELTYHWIEVMDKWSNFVDLCRCDDVFTPWSLKN